VVDREPQRYLWGAKENMNEPEKIFEILQAAKERGYLALDEPCPALNRAVNTANRILSFIKEAKDGLNTAQVKNRSGLDITTIRVYTKILRDLGYLESSVDPKTGRGGTLIHFFKSN
jgi:hypothetical protein